MYCCIWFVLNYLNTCCIFEISSSDKNDYYIIFLMYNEMFCARYIYKYDNFYILMVIVT
jgi:hypothetical protein